MAVAKKIPQRQCIGCGEMKNKKDLIRILKAADNTISIDATGKKNGRGAYICPNAECLKKAISHKGLERAFKTAIEPFVYEELKKEMDNIG